MLNPLELTGRSRTHVRELKATGGTIHHEATDPLLAMRDAAKRDGIVIEAYSSFREFGDQVAIWNAKFTGGRPLYDTDGKPRDFDSLSPDQIVECILCWSALPGGSRHHWGTDIDVIDRAAMKNEYQVQLLPSEYAASGVFSALNEWLDEHLQDYGFFRPYTEYRGGINPEPWHISYAPVAVPALDVLTTELLADVIQDSDMQGKELVLKQLEEIATRYIRNITPAPGA